jgi:hypothetical protein
VEAEEEEETKKWRGDKERHHFKEENKHFPA